MPPIVTVNATIMCVHGGQVILTPRQTQLIVQGGPVLCEPDLAGCPIVGCAQPPSPGSKPCTLVVSTLPGSSTPRLTVQGRPVYWQPLSGITDGVPPGTIMCVNPGQTVLQVA